MRAIAATLLFILVACSPAREPTSQRGERTQEIDTAPLPPAIDLEGEWRVGGLNGKEIDKPYAIVLRGSGARIWWEPDCAREERYFTIEGNAFRTVPTPDPIIAHLACESEVDIPEELSAIWQALDNADKIERTQENGIRIAGEGRSVLLFSQ